MCVHALHFILDQKHIKTNININNNNNIITLSTAKTTQVV